VPVKSSEARKLEKMYTLSPNLSRVDKILHSFSSGPLQDSYRLGIRSGVSLFFLYRGDSKNTGSLIEYLAKQAARFAAAGIGFEVIAGCRGVSDAEILHASESLSENLKIHVELNLSGTLPFIYNSLVRKYSSFSHFLFINQFPGGDLVGKASLQFGDFRFSKSTPYNETDKNTQSVFLPEVFYSPSLEIPGAVQYAVASGDRSVLESDATVQYSPTQAYNSLLIRRDTFYQCSAFDQNFDDSLFDLSLCLTAIRLGIRVHGCSLNDFLILGNSRLMASGLLNADQEYFMRQWRSYLVACKL
jgi:hypothetical protein